MAQQASISGIQLPPKSRVSLKIEIDSEVNITAFVARQKANRFLIMQAGDQLAAGQPDLYVADTLYWRVPVQFAPSRQGALGIVGHLLVDAQTGDVHLADDITIAELLERADTLYARTTL